MMTSLLSDATAGSDPPPADYDCSADYFASGDWWPFLCVQLENSAFLGFFRQVESATRSENSYDDAIDGSEPEFSFE